MMRAASSPLEPLNKNILLAGEVIAEKWKIGEKIGEGTFSQIYSAYSIENRDKVAVKVEAPSSLKPVLEWESLILKSLQDCPYVCRYHYHGKHGDTTVLVMELLGDSMSMLRMSPDSIHGVPLAKSVSVGLEMLDCIEAFHRHGYVHRDIKASNFALSALPDRHPQKQQRYYIIDFGLSRQHIGEDHQVVPAREVAEFRGTSMYASLSSHRRQELGPKDDLWSWFYLVMDFMRGELPWAADAQMKNRQTVLGLKEHYTEKNPSLLVEGLPGAVHLLELMTYLQSLKYEDVPEYAKIRKHLQAVGARSFVSETSDSGDEETRADQRESHAVASVSAIDWNAIDSERERALTWVKKADELGESDGASELLLTIAKRYKTFFDCDGLSLDERMRVQNAVYRIEKKVRARASFLAPPPIQSFVKRRQSEQKMRSDALRKRREKDFQVRRSIEIKNEERSASIQGSNDAAHRMDSGEEILQKGVKSQAGSVFDAQPPSSLGNGRPLATSKPTQQSASRWDRLPLQEKAIAPPPPSSGMISSAQRSGPLGHRPPPPRSPKQGQYTNGEVHPPPAGTLANGTSFHYPPPAPNTEHRYNSELERRPYGAASEETRDDNGQRHRWSQKSLQEKNGSGRYQHTVETREDRGYAPRVSKPPLDDASNDTLKRDTREERGYRSYQWSQNQSQASDRRYDANIEVREEYSHARYHRSQRTVVPHDSPVTKRANDRDYEAQTSQKYRSRQAHGYGDKERHYPATRSLSRSRSRSRSSRRDTRRYRRRSYSRSSSCSRSRSRSYSRSPSRSRSRSPSSRSHRHTSHRYTDRRRPIEYKRSRRHSRSRSSSRSTSSRSGSASPPAKRSRRRSCSFSRPRSYAPKVSNSKGYSKEYGKETYQKNKEYGTEEYSKKNQAKERSKNDYMTEYSVGLPPAQKYVKEDGRNYHRQSYSRESEYQHSPSRRDYRREDGSWDVGSRYSPEKQYRSSRRQ